MVMLKHNMNDFEISNSDEGRMWWGWFTHCKVQITQLHSGLD